MFVIFLLTAITAFFLASFYKKRSKLPPGPIPLPFIGNLHQLGWLSAKYGGVIGAMKELKRIYGPVFTMWLGPKPSVHICSMEIAHETMIKRGAEFTDRWVPGIFDAVNQGLGIIISNGDHWVEQRRFALHTLRNFGLGRGIMEERIMMELDYRTQRLDEQIQKCGAEIQAEDFFDVTVGSIINTMLFGERFEKEKEKEFFKLKHDLDKATAEFSPIDSLYDYPFLRNFPFLKQRWDRLLKPTYDLHSLLKNQLGDRIAAIESGDHSIADEPEDYVDAFLSKMNTEDKDNTTFTVESLTMNLMDLWSAGQETTSITLLNGFYHFLQNPDVVEKVRKELLSVTKGERPLSLMDKPHTPYFNAVNTEIHRLAAVVTINLFRQTKEDITVEGHPVPKGVPIAAEISALMHDDKHFIEANKFDPSRYLNNSKLDTHVNPFGMGKRSCPGESLARAEVYLIAGNMLLRYNIAPPTSESLNYANETNGFFKAAPKYKMRMTKISQ